MNFPRAYFPGTVLSDTTTTAKLYRDGSWIFVSGEMIAGDGYSRSPYLSSVEIYNFTSDTFTAIGSMKYRRGALTLTLLPSGKVLATDGYDQITRSWSDTHILNNGRNNHAAILLNNSFNFNNEWYQYGQ